MFDHGDFDTVPDMQRLHRMRGTDDTANSHIANAPIILGSGGHPTSSATSKSQNDEQPTTTNTSSQGPVNTEDQRRGGSTSPVKSRSTTATRLFPSARHRTADNMDKLSPQSSDDESGAILRGRGRGQLLQSRILPQVRAPSAPQPDPPLGPSPQMSPQHLSTSEAASPQQPATDLPCVQEHSSPVRDAPLQLSTPCGRAAPGQPPTRHLGAPTPSTSDDDQFMDAESSLPAEQAEVVPPETLSAESDPPTNNSGGSTENLRSAHGSELSDVDPSILSVGQCSISEDDLSGIACNIDLDKAFDTSQGIPESIFNISPKTQEKHSVVNIPSSPPIRSPFFLSNLMASGGRKNGPPAGPYPFPLRGFTPLNVGTGTPPLKASSPADSNKSVPGFPTQVSSPIMGNPLASIFNNKGSSPIHDSHTLGTGGPGSSPPRPSSSDTSASSPSQFTSVFGTTILSDSEEEKPRQVAIGRGQILAKLTSCR